MMISQYIPRVCLRCAYQASSRQLRLNHSSIPASLLLSSSRSTTSTSRPRPGLLLRIPPFRSRTTSSFEPLRPPPPSSLPKAAPPRTYKRTRKWVRRLVQLSLLAALTYGVDTYFYDSALTRSFRTFRVGLIASLDYKLNFRAKPWTGGTVTDLHARNAERLFDLLRANGGLYLKIGQAIAMQSAVLPPEFQKMFARMFDDAPSDSWANVAQVIREDFGKEPEEVFGVSFERGETGDDGRKGVMERTARASASVAQVHWARLSDGREVAIKVQKREIARQVGWDLWAFKVITWIWTGWFDLPFYNMVPYVSERLMLETDFQNEAHNSEKLAEYIAAEPRLRGRVYIPKVFHEISSKRVMTAEWIEGVRLWDKDVITKSWKGGWRTGSPGCRGTPLDPPESKDAITPATDPGKEHLKPSRLQWKGPRGDGGLGLSLSTVMQTMVDLFSAQMFLWGFLHCDPHPGNILIRRQPSGQPELVLLDHGLYISMRPEFRIQYARFWKALLAFDNETLAEVTQSWGIAVPDIFASATLMRPYTGGDQSTRQGLEKPLEGKSEQDRAYEMQMRMRKGVKEILADETKWPKELIFIGRNLRIVQGENSYFGSPVNRIKITGTWASRALVESRELSFQERTKNLFRHMIFRLVLFTTDIVFYITRVRQFFGRGGGVEDDLEKQMRRQAKEFGVELQHSVFEG